MTTAADSAEHWECLAVEAVAMSAWERERGIDLSRPGTSAGDYRAATFRQTAEALSREAMSGRPHCSSCGGDHPNHHHPSVAANCGCKCRQSTCPWCRGYRS